MTTPIGLHPIIHFTSEAEFTASINELQKNNCSIVWLKGEDKIIKKHAESINLLLKNTNIDIVSSITLTNTGINIWGLITDNFEEVLTLKQNYPALKIIGLANDVAEAKNFEMAEADMVYLGPIQEIGDEPYITLIPAKPDYEWMFIDITIPVCAFGKIAPETLDSLCQKVNLHGFAADWGDFLRSQKKTLRFTID